MFVYMAALVYTSMQFIDIVTASRVLGHRTQRSDKNISI